MKHYTFVSQDAEVVELPDEDGEMVTDTSMATVSYTFEVTDDDLPCVRLSIDDQMLVAADIDDLIAFLTAVRADLNATKVVMSW